MHTLILGNLDQHNSAPDPHHIEFQLSFHRNSYRTNFKHTRTNVRLQAHYLWTFTSTLPLDVYKHRTLIVVMPQRQTHMKPSNHAIRILQGTAITRPPHRHVIVHTDHAPQYVVDAIRAVSFPAVWISVALIPRRRMIRIFG